MDIKIQPIFDRQKSGYTREFSSLDVFFFNVMGFALGVALSTNPSFIGSFAPTSNILLVIILGATLAFLNGLVYGWFGAIMPSTGGDFVFVSRSISHRIGFLTSWGFTFCQLYGLAVNVGWIVTVGIVPSLITIGYSFHNDSLVSVAGLISGPYLVQVSILIIFLYWFLSAIGFNLSRVVAITLFTIGILGPILIGWELYSHSKSDFINAFNGYIKNINGSTDAYHLAIETAKQKGMVLEGNQEIRESFRAMPIGFLCFLGFTYSVYVGGEVEKPERSQIRGILSALCLGLLTFLLCMGKYIDVVGKDFNASIGNSDVLQKLALPANSMNFFVGIITTNKWVNLAMQIGNLMWFLLVPYVILQVCTRNLIAWTCDGLLPDYFLRRSSKTNSPWLASLTISIFAIIFVLIINYTGISLVGAIALASVAYLFTSIGAFILPQTNSSVFSNAPKSAKNKFLGILGPNFQIIGLICVFGFAWIIYAAISFPEVSGGTPFRALIMVLSVYLLGLIFYQWRKNILKQKEVTAAVDLNQLFKEIPED